MQRASRHAAWIAASALLILPWAAAAAPMADGVPVITTRSEAASTTSRAADALPASAAPAPAGLAIADLTATRENATAVSIRFTSSEAAIGRISYVLPDGASAIIEDPAAVRAHAFVLTGLSPERTYAFTIAASAPSAQSAAYAVSFSPASIGDPGASIAPRVTEAVPAIAREPSQDAGLAAAAASVPAAPLAHANAALAGWLLAALIVLLALTAFALARWLALHKEL
ncbi:MAG TPA: hypothetical protein VFL98_02435 [Candidatus Paceibacterota bacterium]|nr:hypothetical protein [Candidatus Paceibacterota bacterium]